MVRNVEDQLADGQTHCERRFNSPFDGPIISFGADVKFYPMSTKQRTTASVRYRSPSLNIHGIH